MEKIYKRNGYIIFLHMCSINQDDVWFLRYERQQKQFFCHLVPFFTLLPSPPPLNSLINENIKNEKKPADIIILQKCTQNPDHRLYCSWDMALVGCNCYFLFWANFCPFIPLTAQRLKISKNENESWRYYHFTQLHQKSW